MTDLVASPNLPDSILLIIRKSPFATGEAPITSTGALPTAKEVPRERRALALLMDSSGHFPKRNYNHRTNTRHTQGSHPDAGSHWSK